MDFFLLGNKGGESRHNVGRLKMLTLHSCDTSQILLLGIQDVVEMYQGENEQHEERGLFVVPQICAKSIENSTVQTLGMKSMHLAMRNCSGNGAHLGREGIRAALCAMAVHEAIEGLQNLGTSVLLEMVKYRGTYAKVIIEDNGLRILVRNLDMYTEKAVAENRQDLVAENAVLLLLHMIGTGLLDLGFKEELIHAGCVRVLCKTILRHTPLDKDIAVRGLLLDLSGRTR
jgi:hypothetical protein